VQIFLKCTDLVSGLPSDIRQKNPSNRHLSARTRAHHRGAAHLTARKLLAWILLLSLAEFVVFPLDPLLA
jgi:hypothetical protein